MIVLGLRVGEVLLVVRGVVVVVVVKGVDLVGVAFGGRPHLILGLKLLALLDG